MMVSGEEMQEVEKSNYLGVMVSTDGGMERKWLTGCLGKKGSGTMAKLGKQNMISREVKRELYERVVIPTVVYGSDTWSLIAQGRRKIEVYEMMCLRNICGIRRVDLRVGKLRNGKATSKNEATEEVVKGGGSR